MQSGAAANIGNSIAAATTLNLADTTVEGALPGDFVSTTSGSAQTGPTPLETHGTVLASSVQQAGAIGHTATADGNQIALRLISPGANTVAASPELVDNRIAAAFDGNSAGTAIALSAGGAPTFQGSAVVANVQTNSTFGTFGATTDDSLIEAAVSSTAGGATNRLNGGLAVKGNRVVSSATGNAAIGSGPEGAGNRITLGDGLSFDGPGAAAAGSSIGYSNLDSAGNTAGDLVVHNSQRNAGGGSLNARMTANSISATVDLLGGWIDLSGNAIAAAATGNAASNEVANGAGAATFAGTVAMASEQLNGDINIISHNMTGKVSAAVGKSGVGSADASSVAVGGNELSANSFGNRVSQSVSLEANTLALGNGNAVLSGGAPIFGSVSAGGAVTVTSLQRSVRSFTTATNAQSTIDLRSSDPTTADSSFTVDGNAQEAIAVDNDSDNGLSLAGTTVGTGAGLLNSQLSEGGVTAFLNGSTAAITVASADGTSLALTDNLQRVIAYGSNATNDIDVAATSIAVAPWSPMNTASVVSVQSGGLHGPAGSPKTQAAFALLNDQAVTSDVSAFASNPMLHLALSGTLTDSSAENDGNAIVAAAYGTDAANAIGLDAVGISAGTGAGTSIVAAVTNAQASDGDIRAGIDASAIGVAANSNRGEFRRRLDGVDVGEPRAGGRLWQPPQREFDRYHRNRDRHGRKSCLPSRPSDLVDALGRIDEHLRCGIRRAERAGGIRPDRGEPGDGSRRGRISPPPFSAVRCRIRPWARTQIASASPLQQTAPTLASTSAPTAWPHPRRCRTSRQAPQASRQRAAPPCLREVLRSPECW